MRVIFLQNIDGIAGSERYFLALIPKLIGNGLAVEMCCVIKNNSQTKAQPFLDLLISKKIPHSIINCKSYSSPSILLKINQRLKTFRADILHSHLIYADFWAAAVKQFLNKKVKTISTKHGYHENTYVKHCLKPTGVPKNAYYFLFKYSHKRMDASYACSHGLVSFYTKAGLIKTSEMDVIHHGFDYPELLEQEQKYRFSKKQLIITGRLIERKGHHFIIDIMPQLVKKHPDLYLVILGLGKLEMTLKKQVKQLGISQNVKFMGFQTDVAGFLQSSDIMLVTSYSEGLPLVIFEAFNSRTPVVSFDTIGSNELVVNNETGLIIPAFDTDKLAKAINQLLNDKNLSEKLATNAFHALKTKYSLTRMADETMNYYKQTI